MSLALDCDRGALLELGCFPVTAEVTAASAERLELSRGGIAYATFQATGTRLVPLS